MRLRRWLLPEGSGPLIVITIALLFFLICSAAYTAWSIRTYAQKACTELHALATEGHPASEYDHTIRDQYKKLFELRCG